MRASLPVSLATPRPGVVVRLLDRLAAWSAVRAQRRALLGLNDLMLHDIGLTRADALHEGERPFWDLPPRWR